MLSKDHEEWRRFGIGSSDAMIIMGTAPKGWGTPREVWEEKYLGKVRERSTPAMSRGVELEPVARQCFQDIVGTSVPPEKLIHPQHSWVRASLDGISSDRKIAVEIKCPGKDDHKLALSKKVPEKYWPQVQHQLLVTGLDGMYYFSFDGKDGVIVEVARDHAYIDKMFEEEKKFWDLVLNGTPPELTEADYVCRSDNSLWVATAKELNNIKNEVKALKERESHLSDKLKSLSEGRSSKDGDFAYQKQLAQGAIDYHSAIGDYLCNLRSHNPGIDIPDVPLEPYRKNSFEKWVFRSISK